MAIVQSIGALAALGNRYAGPTYSRVRLYNQYYYDYATIWRTQPNVRVCVDFLARNIAHLGLFVYKRMADNDRRRLRDHPLAFILARPLPREYKVTYYRLMENVVGDLGVYFNAYLLKVGVDAAAPLGLLRVPPPAVTVKGELVPTGYEVTVGGRTQTVKATDIVHVWGYNAGNPVIGMAPLETLRRILAEEHAAGDYREGYWEAGARMAGIVSRPANAPEWSKEARGRFKDEFGALYSGEYGSGKTAVLEEGMTWQATTFNAQESEYLLGRKLTREECARAYHIPPPLVGILDHATFSNIKEQHKHLYQDTLGPWLGMIEQDVALQLLTDFESERDVIERVVYCEFNISEKLQGSFEEQVGALQTAVGRPWMTPDEARGRFNMEALGGDADRLGVPLNVLVGGQAMAPSEEAPSEEGTPAASAPEAAAILAWADVLGKAKASDAELDPTLPALRARHVEKWAQVLGHTFERQRAAVVGKLKGKASSADVWDGDRWDAELGADLYRLNYATAQVWAQYVADQLGTEVDMAKLEPWLAEHARIQAEQINASTVGEIDQALVDEDPLQAVRDVFALALSVRAFLLGTEGVTSAANFGAFDAARNGGLRRKTWRVRNSNPRPAHAALDGVSVGIGELFPNGMRWPGDPAGGADNNAGCDCVVTFGR